jgi:putative membrane protein
LWLAGFSFFAFSVAHAFYRLGSRNAVMFVGLAFGMSLLFEVVGVRSGWPFGSYYYTEKLGCKLFGLVPILVPMAWFIMMYASHTLATALLCDWSLKRPHVGVHERVRRAIPRAALAAAVMTAWDLVLDPLMVAHGHWVWLQGGHYFGIPVQNFAGWLALTFFVCLIYYCCESPRAVANYSGVEDRIACLPLWSYMAIGIATSLGCAGFGQLGAGLIGFLSMSVFPLALLRQRIAQHLPPVGQPVPSIGLVQLSLGSSR